MIVRLGIPLALAALLAAAAPAVAQDSGGKAPPKEGGAAAPAPAPVKPDEPQVEVKGNRYAITMKTGSKIVGLLPRGLVWERIDQYGEFADAVESDKGAGLRLFYVLDMEGEMFIKRSEIAPDGIRDLGALTDEQKRAIKDRVIAERRRHLEDREKALREEMARLSLAMKEEEKRAAAKPGEKKPGAESAETDEVKKGEALLEKFPPDQWSEQRLKDILRREVVNGIFRNDEEREFIDNFKTWKQAFDRREKAEAEKKGGEKPPTEGGK
jgi:hypothetical protein